MLSYRYDTQLLVEGEARSKDAIYDEILAPIPGDSLLVVGDESLIKLHYHTNAPWKVLEFCAGLKDMTLSWRTWSGKRAVSRG